MREVSFATYMAYLDHIAKRYVENRFFGKMALGGKKEEIWGVSKRSQSSLSFPICQFFVFFNSCQQKTSYKTRLSVKLRSRDDMKLVDAHIHLSDPEYNQKVDEILEDAKRSNVVALVSNSMNIQTSRLSLQLAEEYPNLVYAALGIHPWNVRRLSPNEVQETVDLILQHETHSGRVVAVGEIGLDYQYASKKLRDSQLKVLHEMLSAAEKKSLPVIIHSRGTTSQIVSLLSSYSVKKVLLHWFSRPMTLLPQIVDRGYYISEGLPSVYSNHTREIIKRIPLTNLLTETDVSAMFFNGPVNI